MQKACKCLLGATLGALFGLVLTFITTTCLTLISVTMIFNLYVGACFLFIGSMMVFKLYRKNKMVDIDLGTASGAN